MPNPYIRALGFVLAAVSALGSAPAEALQQVNPVQQAGPVINYEPSQYAHEYPWFSNDGKLMLWTRQKKSMDCVEGDEFTETTKGCQRVYVTFIKNRDAVAGAADGVSLPALDVAVPQPLTPVNAWADDQTGPTTIKAIAVCEEGDQPADLDNRWRYRFSLFMAVGPPCEDEGPCADKRLWRAHRVFVVVKKSTQEITRIDIAEDFAPVTGSDVAGKNETEPMLTRDGAYLFWASNAFNGTVAKFMGPVSSCSQLDQNAKTYDQLPDSRFAWKAQYLAGSPSTSLSRTNYHTVLERPNGTTALIYERCHGQEKCIEEDPSSIDCDCGYQDNQLSTSGFSAGSGPSLIGNWSSGPLNGGARVTHPAISGPRTNNAYLLFFMRGKKIWYTRIKE